MAFTPEERKKEISTLDHDRKRRAPQNSFTTSWEPFGKVGMKFIAGAAPENGAQKNPTVKWLMKLERVALRKEVLL